MGTALLSLPLRKWEFRGVLWRTERVGVGWEWPLFVMTAKQISKHHPIKLPGGESPLRVSPHLTGEKKVKTADVTKVIWCWAHFFPCQQLCSCEQAPLQNTFLGPLQSPSAEHRYAFGMQKLRWYSGVMWQLVLSTVRHWLDRLLDGPAAHPDSPVDDCKLLSSFSRGEKLGLWPHRASELLCSDQLSDNSVNQTLQWAAKVARLPSTELEAALATHRWAYRSCSSA